MHLIHNFTSVKNLRILIFGDTHGRSIWRKVVEDEGMDNLDLVIFLGDYFTSREGISEFDQNINWMQLVEFREEYPDKVVLLRGNHDMEAIGYEWAECYPSYRGMWVADRADWFLDNTQWVLQIGEYVFSHAGITQRWFEDVKKEFPEVKCFDDLNDIEPCAFFGFRTNKMSDYYGDSPTQPLTWIRPASLCEYGYPDITYIVGHTTKPSIINEKHILIEQYSLADFAKCDVWVCDTLPRQYMLLDKGEIKIKDIK